MAATTTDGISIELLAKQNAETSSALIDYLALNEDFQSLSTYEGDLTVARDREDAEKLQKGIDFAKAKGVIDPDFQPEPYVSIDVLGKTPDQVADLILETSATDNTVIVLVVLSGTGKGTTTKKLLQKLQATGKQVVTWSNGNVFRSVTLLAATWSEQNGGEFSKEKALTKENIEQFMGMLHFGKNAAGQYDTRIKGLGLDLWVSEVQNTELKSPKVSKNIPTVAEFTQGEVILFAAKAVKEMGENGLFVLLEGREQTVNYVRTPNRFALVLSDESLIGKRRAAQRVMGAVASVTVDTEVAPAIEKALKAMVAEI